MKNECMMTAITITSGAVLAFFAALGYFARSAYLNGFAAGFTEARERFARVLKVAGDRKLYREILSEFERDSDPQ